MTIYFYDGSTAECEEVEFYGDKVMFDHVVMYMYQILNELKPLNLSRQGPQGQRH